MTALLDPEAQAAFEALRRAHFPPERNHIPAHVTLFHHLPGSLVAEVRRDLAAIAGAASPPPVEVREVRSTGRGVAYRLHSPALEAARAELAARWAGLLTPQDRHGFRPHVTVQNKVPAETARQTQALLAAGFRPWTTRVVAFGLWRYLGGPWEALARVPFRGR